MEQTTAKPPKISEVQYNLMRHVSLFGIIGGKKTYGTRRALLDKELAVVSEHGLMMTELGFDTLIAEMRRREAGAAEIYVAKCCRKAVIDDNINNDPEMEKFRDYDPVAYSPGLDPVEEIV